MTVRKFRNWPFACALLISFVGCVALFAADAEIPAYFKAVDVAHPRCEDSLDLNPAPEYFVELGNDLPGVEAYNAIVRLYRKQDWPAFEAGVAAFSKQYESSPLREPLAFLYTQSKFDRLTPGDPKELKEAERLLRESLLLYPKSQLAPVVSATAAALWLKRNMYERALSMYEAAAQQYPLDPLACVFHIGVAESNYLLDNDRPARDYFKFVLQKCTNSHLRLIAELRLAALDEAESPLKSVRTYEAACAEHATDVAKYLPSTVLNLGEMKYQEHQYPRAKFYYKEYLKLARKEPQCSAFAEKRLADIALHTGEKIVEVKGLYLAAHEAYPDQDAGKLSKVLALLIDLKQANSAEYERRLKLIDESLDAISDESLKKSGFLTKGLVLLDVGEPSAVDYLVRLHERAPFSLDKGPIGSFLREKVFAFLKETIEEEKEPAAETKAEKDPFATVESIYTAWLKNSPYAERVRHLYAELAASRIAKSAAQGNEKEVIDILKKWKTSQAFSGKSVQENYPLLSGAILRLFHDAKDPRQLSAVLHENEALVRDFTGRGGEVIWAAVAMHLEDDKALKASLDSIAKAGPLPSFANTDGKRTTDYAWLLLGKADLKAKRYHQAERALEQIRDPELLAEKLDQQLLLFELQRLYSRAYYVAKQRVEREKDQKIEKLAKLVELIRKGRLWTRAPEALQLAESSHLSGKDLAAFHFLVAKASFELAHYHESAAEYETALAMDGFSSEAAEARYRLGKCLIKLKRPAEARRIWEELTKMKAPFWSGLAQNEMRLINP